MNIILANCKNGQTKNGVQYTPRRLLPMILNYYNINGFVNITPNAFETRSGYKEIYDSYTKFSKYNRQGKILTLGGDHSVAKSSCQAFLDKYLEKAHIIWIDAHTDINTHATSKTGNTHGMPVSSLFGLDSHMMTDKSFCLKPHQITYIGPRSIDLAEQELIKRYNIQVFTTDDIKKDFTSVINKVNKRISDKYLHISYDIDVIDPLFLPSTGTPEPNGLTLDENEKLLKKINKKNLVSADFVELNLELTNNKTDCLKIMLNNILNTL